MISIGFAYIKGGTGKTVLATSAALYLNAVGAPAALIDASPVPMAALLMGASASRGMHAGRQGVPVFNLRGAGGLREALKALEAARVSVVAVDLPPAPRTPRLDIVIAVTDPPGLHFAQEFKADAPLTILALNKSDGAPSVTTSIANAVVALPYSPGVERAYQRLLPPILVYSERAPSLARWKRAFLELMHIVAEELRR
jgi:hypothetical protein